MRPPLWNEPSSAVSATGVLIDGDNISHEQIERILERARELAPLLVPRVYGNWDSPTMQGWQRALIPYRLERRHHDRTVPGKNATDILLVIDALELLYQYGIRRFCLVASDSDYTPLIRHLRNLGCYVLGIGMETASQAMQEACDLYVFLCQLSEMSIAFDVEQGEEQSSTCELASQASVSLETKVLTAYAQLVHGLEWVPITDLEKQLKRLYPGFAAQQYGHRSIHRLVKAELSTLFEMRPRPGATHIQEIRRRSL